MLGAVLKGIFTKPVVHNFIRKGVGTLIGNALDRRGSQRAFEKQYNFYRRQGLNPNEIVGSVSGSPQGATQSLGNMDDIRLAQDKELRREQLSLERAKIDQAERASIRQAQTQVATATLASDTNLAGQANTRAIQTRAQDLQRQTALDQLANQRVLTEAQAKRYNAETAKVLQSSEFEAVVHSERWPRLFSTMSAENVAASAIAVLHGVDVQKVLKNVDATRGEKETLAKMLISISSMRSTTQIETAGVAETIRRAFDYTFGQDPLPKPEKGPAAGTRP